MPQLPREQLVQRHPRGVVSAHGVTLWESVTDLVNRAVENADEVEDGEVALAEIPFFEVGSSSIDRDGINRDDWFGRDDFGDDTFGSES